MHGCGAKSNKLDSWTISSIFNNLSFINLSFINLDWILCVPTNNEQKEFSLKGVGTKKEQRRNKEGTKKEERKKERNEVGKGRESKEQIKD